MGENRWKGQTDSLPPLSTTRSRLFGGSRASRLQDKRVRVLWWWLRMRGFEYMSCGFLLLSFESTIHYWQSIYYFLHISMLLLIPVAYYLNRKPVRVVDKNE